MENIRLAMNRGAFDFVVKPIDYDDLEITIAKANEAVEKEKAAKATSQKLVQTEHELSASEEREQTLRELDELKNRLFTQISHEFRTPLTVILGMAEQVEQQPERWQKKGLAMIRQNGSNLLDLINQLLDLRKLEAGKLAARFIQGEIIAYLQYLTASFESLAEMQEIKLSFQSQLPSLNMDHDPDKLLRILTNLLSNAIKFTPAGGSVQVLVEVGNGQLVTDKNLLITVSDTGMGIPEDALPLIFDPFFQAENAYNQGTGIGLALMKELVQLMGGKVDVKSKEGKGASFSVYLPIRQQAPFRSPDQELMPIKDFSLSTTATELIETKTEQVEELPSLLIIEDNTDVTQYLVACLEGRYRLLTAQDGEEGIQKALEEVPDLILTDLMMPKKDGYEVCQTLKTDDRTSHVPIILLTAKSDVESRISGLALGADAYLPKPFEKRELLIRLENLIRVRQRLQARYQGMGMPAPSEDQAVQKEDAFILKVRELILTNLDEPELNVSKLSEMAALSRSQFHNKLKALTGISGSFFLRKVRLQEARKMLDTSSLQIAEIAYSCGFSSPAYFTRVFSEEFNQSPTAYRKGG